jgi:hypothetical protein
MMNFSAVENKSNEGVWINIDDVNGVQIEGVRVKILGIDSDAYKKKQRQITDKRINNRKMKITSAELESEGLSLIASCVVEWEGVEDNDGAVVCNESNVRKFLSENTFIKEQIDAAIADRANFIGSFKKD